MYNSILRNFTHLISIKFKSWYNCKTDPLVGLVGLILVDQFLCFLWDAEDNLLKMSKIYAAPSCLLDYCS